MGASRFLLIVVGVLLALLGVFILLLSMRASRDEFEERSEEVTTIGPLSIILGGRRLWLIAVLALASLIVFLILYLKA